MESNRCGRCRKLLFRGIATDIEIKCSRCGAFNRFRATSLEPERQRASKETFDATRTKEPSS